jgi:hypothetical protein
MGLRKTGGCWRLLFSFKVLDRVLHSVPFVEPGNVSNREHFVGPFLGLNLRARTVKPEKLAGGGINFRLFHLTV